MKRVRSRQSRSRHAVHSRPHANLVAAAVAAAIAGNTALAQNSELEEIIVTATKRALDIQTVPLSVTAVGGEVLVERQIKNVQALNLVIPGLTIRSAGFNTAAIIRGAGSAGTSDIAVPFYSDGMYMPNNGQALATFVDIDRIEGLRGPQGTLFGRNTFGGLVNIITRKPKLEELDYGGAVTVGDYALRKVEGMVNAPLGETMAVRFTGVREERDPYVKNNVNRNGGFKDADNTYLRAQFRYQPSKAFFVNVSYVDWKDTANGTMNWGYKLLGVPLSRTDPTRFDPANGFLDPRAGVQVGCATGGDRPGGAYWAGNVCSSDPREAAAARITGGPFEIPYDTTPVRKLRSKAYYLNIGWQIPGHELKLGAARFKYDYSTFVDADFTSLPNLADGEGIRGLTDQVDLSIASTGDGRLSYTGGIYFYDRPLEDNSYAYLFAGLSPSWSGTRAQRPPRRSGPTGCMARNQALSPKPSTVRPTTLSLTS